MDHETDNRGELPEYANKAATWTAFGLPTPGDFEIVTGNDERGFNSPAVAVVRGCKREDANIIIAAKDTLTALRNTAFPFHQMAQGHFGNFDSCLSPVCAGNRAAIAKAEGK